VERQPLPSYDRAVPRRHPGLWALAAALPLLAVLAACGSGSSSTTATEPPASAGSSSAASSPAAAGSTTCSYSPDGQKPSKEVTPPPSTTDLTGQVKVTIDTSVGPLDATLDATKAPCTVASFVSLADQGYFDNTPCHRLTTEGIYVLQCGDPTGTGTGGPGYSFPDELSGSETYPAGTLAMANSGPDTNGSQFFVVYRDTGLGPDYTVFGTITPQSVATVKKVAAAGVDNAFGAGDGHPKEKVTITGVTTQ
jgi:peptidyl-prolyl cis-trans isomerase B (cyclophilin B)